MTSHRIGTRDEWVAARAALLTREKEHTRLGDELARQRRELPWVLVEKQIGFFSFKCFKSIKVDHTKSGLICSAWSNFINSRSILS